MAIAKELDFVSGVTPVSEDWLDLVQELLGAYVSPTFKLEESSSTVLRVPAADDHASVAIVIAGEMRRRDTNATVTVSGASETKDVYVTADSADHLFALEVTSGAPVATKFRKIGEVDWSGTAITAVRNTLAGHEALSGLSDPLAHPQYSLTTHDHAGVYSTAGHLHGGVYVPVSHLTSGDHDSRYYTETEVDSLLAAKSATGHTHTGSTISGLDTGDTTTGIFALARIPTGTTSSTVALGNHNHSGVYAPVHSHPYLATAGGTLTGNLGLWGSAGGVIMQQSGEWKIIGTSVGNFNIADWAGTIVAAIGAGGIDIGNRGLQMSGAGAIDMFWSAIRRINDSAWGSLRLEGDNNYRVYFHTSTKYAKSGEEDVLVEDSYKALSVLRPLTYNNEEGKRNIGFFAENVQKAEPLTAPKPRKTKRGPDEVTSYSEDGIIAHLVNVVNDLAVRVGDLEGAAA